MVVVRKRRLCRLDCHLLGQAHSGTTTTSTSTLVLALNGTEPAQTCLLYTTNTGPAQTRVYLAYHAK